MEEHQVSVTQACRVVSLHRSLWYYQSTRDDSDIQEAFTKLVDKLPHRGFDTYYDRQKAQGVPWGRTRMLRVYREITNFRGIPRSIRVDNGPEFTSKAFATWCKEHAIEIKFIQPGKPTQNAYIERFNRLFREDILDAYLFEDLRQVKRLRWRMEDRLQQISSAQSFNGKESFTVFKGTSRTYLHRTIRIKSLL